MRMPFIILVLLAATPARADDACLSEVTQLAAKNKRIEILYEVKRELEFDPAKALGLALLGPLVAAQHEQRVAIAEAEVKLKASRSPNKCRQELLKQRMRWLCPLRDFNGKLKEATTSACSERVFAETYPEAAAQMEACPDEACKDRVYAEAVPDIVAETEAIFAEAKEAVAKVEASKAAEEAKAKEEAAARKAAEDAWAAKAEATVATAKTRAEEAAKQLKAERERAAKAASAKTKDRQPTSFPRW
jgi:colicin import membrane protein